VRGKPHAIVTWTTVLAVVLTAGLALAQSPTLSTDKNDYHPGERVTITGSDWSPGETVRLLIQATGHAEVTLDATADDSGAFTNTDFAADADDAGLTFTITGTGVTSGATAIAVFTDSAVSIKLDQGRNGTAASPTDPVDMQNGNAGASNAHYLEGHSIPYRIVLGGLAAGSHNLKIEWDIRDSSKNSIDYITHYQRLLPHTWTPSHSAETVDPLIDVAGNFTPGSTFPIPAPSSAGSPLAGQPTSSFNALPASGRSMTIFNGSITAISYVSQGSLTASKSSTRLSIDFTTDSSTVVLAWGGHIASAGDWGSGNSAGGINGSSYHTSVVELDGQGGNQDRSMQADAVPAPPSCSISGALSVCAGSTNTYTASTNASSPAYSWSLHDNTSGASFAGGTTGASVTVNSGAAGSYAIRVLITAANGSTFCEDSVAVAAGPHASAGPDQSFCKGDSAQIGGSPTASGGSGSYAITWSPATGLSDIHAANPKAAPAAPTTYIVLVTDGSDCAARDTVIVTPYTGPTVDAGANKSFCRGDSVQIGGSPTASGGTAPLSITWSPATGLSDIHAANPKAAPSSTTTYHVLVTDLHGCSGSDSMTVSPYAGPVADAGPDKSFCEGESVQIGGNPTASGGTAPYTITWSPATGLSNVHASNPTASPASTTTYYLLVADSHGCTDLDTMVVTVNPPPAACAGSDRSICLGDSTTLGCTPTASGGTPPYVITWSPPAGLNDIHAANPVAKPITDTTYFVLVTDHNGCAARDTVVITVSPLPSASAGPDKALCAGDSVQIGGNPTASGGTPPLSITWSPATGLSDIHAANPKASPPSTTTYYLLVKDSHNCTARDTVEVQVHQPPTANAGPDKGMCAGDSVLIGGNPTASGGTAPYTITWSPATGLSDKHAANPKAAPASTTTYIVLVVDHFGCADRDTMIVNVHPGPTAAAGPNQSLCAGGSVQIGGSPTASAGTPPYTYDWTPPAGLDNVHAENPHASPSSTTTYTVSVTDHSGCSAQASVTVQVNQGGTAFQLIAVNDVDHKGDQLLRIDVATGIGSTIGPLGIGCDEVDGMAVLPGLDGPDRIYGADSDRLVQIDPTTGAATLIGPIGHSLVDGLCFQPGTNQLFGTTYGSNRLLKINIATGASVVQANNVASGHRLNDMTFHPDGRCFVVTQDSPPLLFQVNPVTGAKIKKWTVSGTKQIEAILWSLDGRTLYCGAKRSGFMDLATIDLAASKVVFVGPAHSGYTDIEALAWLRTAAPCDQNDTPTPTKAAPQPESPAITRLSLYQNSPNPFNPTTTIRFDLPQAAAVSLTIFDVSGRMVKVLAHGWMPQGQHEVRWSGDATTGGKVSSGVYYYVLRTPLGVETRRMIMLK
jgi:hypothetical protein